MLNYATVAKASNKPIDGVLLGTNVQRFREARGWSRPELGRRAELDDQYIYRLERGNHPRSSRETAQKLADALEVSIIELVSDPSILTFGDVNGEFAELIQEYAPNTPPDQALRALELIDVMTPEEKVYWLGVFERVLGGRASRIAEQRSTYSTKGEHDLAQQA